MGKKKLKQVKYDELKSLRIELYKEQGSICAILKKPVPHDKLVLDHQHKTRAETIGANGAGLLRGVLHAQVNSVEGRIRKSFIRGGIGKLGISFTDFLRNLADYLDQENLPLIHPDEQPKPKKLKKSSYNKLKKVVNGKQKIPNYPKSRKLIKALDELYKKYKIEPEFYVE